MKAILYLDEGSLIVTDIYNLPDRKERETQYEFEKRLVRKFNDSQPAAKHKVVRIHLMRN
jgi:hypothetical protein